MISQCLVRLILALHITTTQYCETTPPKQLEPVAGISPSMTDLKQFRRSEILAIQEVLKRRYRDKLKYTFDSAGIFSVVLPHIHGKKDEQFYHLINSCHTPPEDSDGETCTHECDLVFNEQSWEVAPIPGDFGQCLDDADIWLEPRKALLNFAAYPLVDNF